MPSAPTLESLRLEEFSDRDLLFAVEDTTEDDGYVGSDTLASHLFPSAFRNGNKKRKIKATQCVAIRLSWMRRIGVVERYEPEKGEARPHPSRWALTDEGVLFMNGDVPRAVQTALNKLAENQLFGATSWLTEQYVGASPVAAQMIRRAWKHGSFQRVNGNGTRRRRSK